VVAEFAVGVGAGLVPHKADRRPWAAGGLPRGSRLKPGAPCRRSGRLARQAASASAGGGAGQRTRSAAGQATASRPVSSQADVLPRGNGGAPAAATIK
jgi:hypothetical protein